MAKLQALVAHAGGWNISRNLDPSVDFEERVRVVQNELGLSVFFNWGVIEHNGTYSVAVIAGGWNEALVLVSDPQACELKCRLRELISCSCCVQTSHAALKADSQGSSGT